jgi:hypothetical protein
MSYGPVKTFFKGDGVATSIGIGIDPDSDAMKSIIELECGTDVKVKCRLGYGHTESCVCLIGEDMEEVESVKVAVN